MNSMLVKWKSRDFLVVILFLQFIACTIVFFDVPIARQVIGFVYFSFVPGFIIIELLKLDELNGVEIVLFSVGFSIAFLMFVGLFINQFSFLFGISQPLSLIPLMIVMNSFILIGGVLVHLRNGSFNLWSSELDKTSLFALFFLCLPILSIVGAMWVNIYGNNLILLFMMITIPLLFSVGVISKKLLPPRLYPLAVLMIAIALLYHSSLISNYLIHFGSDVGGEYFAFKTTETNAYWNSTNPYVGGEWTAYGRIHSMLSVTILPTIYSSLLNVNPIWMFKILFPLIFSLVPLGLYQVWQTCFGRKFAFISAFLFMAQSTFYTEAVGLNKQMVAELFFVLLLLVIVNRKIRPVNKVMCFMIFSFALVTSHYALAEIFLFFISSTLILLIVLKRPSRNITVSMVVFFFVIMFFWYMYTSDSAVFDSLLEFGDYVYNQLGDFFDPGSRGQTVLTGLGMVASPTIWNTISRIFAYLTQALIVIGFFGLVTKRTRIHLEVEYFALTLFSVALLAALILVPGLANTLNMTRFYHILLVFLAPLCALGVETIVSLISRRRMEIKVSILLLMVLFPYFLFQTNFVYEVAKSDSWSVSLSKYRMSALRLSSLFGYTDAYSVFGAQWLSNTAAVGHSQIYAGSYSRSNELRIYGMVYLGDVEILSNITEVKPSGLVYLSSSNVIEGIVVGRRLYWNLSELHFLNDLSKIYSNCGSEVYKNGP